MSLYKDALAPVEARMWDLLGRMTLQEKAGQMPQIERTVVSPRILTELGAGSILSGGGSAPSDRASLSEWACMVDDTQQLALSSRLGVPVLYGIDAVQGHNHNVGATVFPPPPPPHNVGLRASSDAELLRKISQATALEVRTTSHHWAFAPCLVMSQIQK
jgi:beta-glucosidase